MDRGTLNRHGVQLKTVRKAADLTQAQVCAAMGMKTASSRAYFCRLEKGGLKNVTFLTIVRYLRACKAPAGKWSLRDGFAFMLELVQSGAFGEAEAGGVRGITSVSGR